MEHTAANQLFFDSGGFENRGREREAKGSAGGRGGVLFVIFTLERIL